MKKSVYSLVLSDEVVAAIDELAYRQGTSRSNLINQILAEHVSMPTPEKRMKDIFTAMEELMDESFQFQLQPSDSMLSIRSPLRYKYKPTIRYSLELFPAPGKTFGRLRVSFRTQNEDLIDHLIRFFRYFIRMEQHDQAPALADDSFFSLDGGRFTRVLRMPAGAGNLSSDALANGLADYIGIIDSTLKTYFAALDDPRPALQSMEKQYQKYLQESSILV